jgi:acetolactate synthase-1/2/3 large subunit
MTQLAVKHATTGEPGPAAVIFHSRALFARIDAGLQPPTFLDRSYSGPKSPVATAEAITQAAELIRGSSRPVVIAGNGIRLAQAERELAAFAHTISAPVATTPGGKGTFPENHPLAVGVIGSFGHDAANAVVGDADLLIAVGTKLGATDTANANRKLIDLDRQKLVHIDIEPLNISWTFPADAAVLGDANDALRRLAVELVGYSSDGGDRVGTARTSHGYFDRPLTSTLGRLSGRDVVSILSRELADDAVVTCDAGENRLFVLRDFQAKQGGTVLQPNGGGGMGYAIPASMAVAVNFPGRPAVAVCGDGGFTMSLHSLVSAVELGLQLTVVVLDNHVLGWVYNGQRGRIIASEFKDFDYAAIAASMGAHAVSVDSLDDFRDALRAAQRRTGVSVIVANTTKDDRYQDVMSSLNSRDVYAVPDPDANL